MSRSGTGFYLSNFEQVFFLITFKEQASDLQLPRSPRLSGNELPWSPDNVLVVTAATATSLLSDERVFLLNGRRVRPADQTGDRPGSPGLVLLHQTVDGSPPPAD